MCLFGALVWRFWATVQGVGFLGRAFRLLSPRVQGPNTWTPKVCRIIAFYRFWAIILATFGV